MRRHRPMKKPEQSFEEQRKTLLTAIKYCRKNDMPRSVVDMRWQLVSLRRKREAKNSWKRIHQ